MFVLIYSSEDDNAKIFKAKACYLPKVVIKNYNIIIYGKKLCDQAIDSDIKQYDEIKKLTNGQSEDYITRCLLDYDYIRNQYRLIVADLSRQKELDADLKAIQQIEFVGQLKNIAGLNTDSTQPMFVLTILEKKYDYNVLKKV